MKLKKYCNHDSESKYRYSVCSINTSCGIDDNETERNNKNRCPTPRPPHVSVEKVEGGFMIAGVIVFNSCQFILPAFGCLFLVVGIVLTLTSYQGVSTSEKVQQYIERVEFTKNSKLLGPICLAVASFMILSGFILCILSKRAQLRQQKIGFHCPLHGDFYPSNGVPYNHIKSRKRRFLCCGEDLNPDEENLVGIPPPCPHSNVSSQRSSFSSACLMSSCPAPLPFVVTNGSLSGLTTGSAMLPSELVFGSIRSLSVSHDVASFPVSRSPSPTPIDRLSPCPSPINIVEDFAKINAGIILNKSIIARVTPEIKLVAPAGATRL